MSKLFSSCSLTWGRGKIELLKNKTYNLGKKIVEIKEGKWTYWVIVIRTA